MLRNLLVYRLAIFNLLVLLGLGFLQTRGLVSRLYAEDSSYITSGCTAIFALAMFGVVRHACRVSRWLNADKRLGSAGRMLPRGDVELGRDKAMAKVEWLHDVPGILTTLGLLGTIVGFGLVLDGIDSQAAAGGASGVQRMLAAMIEGLRVKINTTVVGVALAMWLGVNLRMLATAHENLWNDRVLHARQA